MRHPVEQQLLARNAPEGVNSATGCAGRLRARPSLLLLPPWGAECQPDCPGSLSASLSVVLVSTLACAILPLLVWFVVAIGRKRYARMNRVDDKPFPLLALPRELRDNIYHYLMEDPSYPPPPPAKKTPGSTVDWMLAGRWASVGAAQAKARKSNWIFLANKQVHKEYMEMLCKKATFHLTVTPQSYQPPPSSPPSLPSTSSPSEALTDPSTPLVPLTTPSDALTPRIWTISPHTLRHLRNADLRLITTSAMLGSSDPRAMPPTSWPFARLIRTQLSHLSNISTLTLDAKAIGDPLWNPLWIWYHASQSFKHMGTEMADTKPPGPRLSRITFSLDTWSPGENYLARDEVERAGVGRQVGVRGHDGATGPWAWWCMKGHRIMDDGAGEMGVREFCARLYAECRVCRPEGEEESDAE